MMWNFPVEKVFRQTATTVLVEFVKTLYQIRLMQQWNVYTTTTAAATALSTHPTTADHINQVNRCKCTLYTLCWFFKCKQEFRFFHADNFKIQQAQRHTNYSRNETVKCGVRAWTDGIVDDSSTADNVVRRSLASVAREPFCIRFYFDAIFFCVSSVGLLFYFDDSGDGGDGVLSACTKTASEWEREKVWLSQTCCWLSLAALKWTKNDK